MSGEVAYARSTGRQRAEGVVVAAQDHPDPMETSSIERTLRTVLFLLRVTRGYGIDSWGVRDRVVGVVMGGPRDGVRVPGVGAMSSTTTTGHATTGS